MNVISRTDLRAAADRHPQARRWVDAWWKKVDSQQWYNLHDVRREYPATDQVGGCLVFNACGNNYRLIVGVAYANKWKGGTLYFKHFLTHAEYDQGDWKKDC